MDFFDLGFWQSVASNFGATIIGAFLGVFLALVFEKQREEITERKHKSKILIMIKDELEFAQRTILEFYKRNETQSNSDIRHFFWTIKANIKTSAWDTLSDSGDLQWIDDTELLLIISNAYFVLDAAGAFSDKYFQMCMTQYTAESEIGGWTIRQMNEAIEKTMGDAKHSIEVALKHIANAEL